MGEAMTGYQSKKASAQDKLTQWLEALHHSQEPESVDAQLDDDDDTQVYQQAQPAQEPVAWTLLLTGEHHGIIGEAGEKFIGAPECYQRVNVYTTPPKREWVGLTDEQIKTIEEMSLTKNMAIAMTMATLKEKNT
jgi:hypothetical protein